MFSYLIVALVAVYAKRLKTVLWTTFVLKTFLLIIVILIGSRATITGIVLSYVISFGVGIAVHFYFKKRRAALSTETFKSKQRRFAYIVGFILLIVIAFMVYTGYLEFKNSQKLVEVSKQKAEISSSLQDKSQPVVGLSQSNLIKDLSGLNEYEPDFENYLSGKGVSYNLACSYHNGSALEYNVYNLSVSGQENEVAYVTQECIPFGPQAGRCHTLVDFYSVPARLQEGQCERFVKERAGDNFRFYREGKAQR